MKKLFTLLLISMTLLSCISNQLPPSGTETTEGSYEGIKELVIEGASIFDIFVDKHSGRIWIYKSPNLQTVSLRSL
jgi:hypothetical protein